MQGENRRKPHSPGPECPHAQAAHHVCHSCGWTFPNPHPSAKQRRAHRKHCGKIDGFPLLSPHGDDDGGNNDEDGSAAAAASALGEKPSDVDPHQQKMSISSLAVETVAMEVGEGEECCGMEQGVKTLESIGFHGDDVAVIHEGNAELPPETTVASACDNNVKVPNLPCEKDVQELDVVNVIDERAGIEAIAEKVSWEESNGDLEIPPVETIKCHGSVDTKLKSLNKDNFADIDVLSNLINTCSKETGSPGADIAMNLKEVATESCHTRERNNDEVGKEELESAHGNPHSHLMKVFLAEHQGARTDSDMVENENNIFDGTVKENEDNCSPFAFQVLQNVHEENNSELNDKVCRQLEQVKSDTSFLPSDNQAILSPECCLRDPDLGGIQSDVMLTELDMDDAFKDHEVHKCQGQAEPSILEETPVIEADLKLDDCNIYPGFAELGSEIASVKSGEDCVRFFSSVQLNERNLELEEEGGKCMANNSDENENRIDGGSEIKECIKEVESGLTSESIRVGDPMSGELLTFTFTMKDQLLHNLIRGLDGPVTSLDHVEENIECSFGDKVSLTDMEHQSKSEEKTVDNDGTGGLSNLPIQANEGKMYSYTVILTDSGHSSKDTIHHQEAPTEMIDPEFTPIISDVKSLYYQDSGENIVQENQDLPESVTSSNEGSQPYPRIDMGSKNHGFIHLVSGLDNSECVSSTEVEDGWSIIEFETEPRSNMTEEKQYSQVEPGKNEPENVQGIMHESPITGTSASITEGTSSNLKSMSSMSNLNLNQDNSQNELYECPTGPTCSGDHDSVAGETDFQTKPSETHTISENPDKEKTLTHNNKVQLIHQSVEIPTSEDMVSPLGTLCGIQNALPLEELNRTEEIVSSISQQPDEREDTENDQDGTRYYQETLKENINPESTSDIYIEPLHYQDIEENKVRSNLESTESVAVSNGDIQPCPPTDVGSQNRGFIHLEAWIDYSACEDSNEKEVEGGHPTMPTETETRNYTTEEKQYVHVDLGNIVLEKVPKVTHASPILDTSTSIIEGTSSSLESLSSMSNLNLHQESTQNEVYESSTEPSVNGDHSSVAGETHLQTKTSGAHTLVSETLNQEKTLDLQNNEVQLTYQPVESPTTDNVVSPPQMISGMQSSISPEEQGRNGEVSFSTCHQSDEQTYHSISKQEETAIFFVREALMDTISQTDSIEGHWGSVSDGMALSASDAIDTLQGFNTEAPPDVKTKRSERFDELSLPKRALSEEQCAVADGSKLSITMESLQGAQQSCSCTSNGSSPSDTQVARESQERKKKEEIIAKVENWSSGKQHTSLKILLVEANHESKHKPQNAPLHKMPLRSDRSQAPLDEGFTRGIPAPISERLTETSARKEAQKEWNSPARLPINKNDKRRAKGKPQWVPFLCCPSLN